MDGMDDNNDLEEKVLHATFGLKILQILMTKNPETLNSRWNIGNNLEESDFFECVTRTPEELYTDLDYGKYIRYSSLMIIIDRVELCDRSHVKLLMKRLENNRYLCHTPIFIICEYGIDVENDNSNEVLEHYLQNIKINKYPGSLSLTTTDLIYPNNFNQPVSTWDELYIGSRKLDNVMLMRLFKIYEWYEYQLFMLTILRERALSCMELIEALDVSIEYILTPGSNDTLYYFFNINPALAIVINNYYFTSPLGVREGSEMDVVHLIREFKLDRIPYIVIEDSDRDKLLAIMKFLQETDFKALKRLMIFVMSHGENGNTIFTNDGAQINTDLDIVKRVLSNTTLAAVQTRITFVHCRGDTDIDMEEVTPDLLQGIKPTSSKHLTDNTTLLYSTPSSMVSYRWPNYGTPAVLSFCKNYRIMSHSDTMEYLWRNMEKDIKKIGLFAELNNCTELVSRAPVVTQRVKTSRIAAGEMLNLIRHFLNYFPNFPGIYFSPGTLFNIIMYRNQLQCEKANNIHLYNAPDLDADISKSDDAWPKLKELQGLY